MSEAGRSDVPAFQLEVELSFEDYQEGVAAHQAASGAVMGRGGLIICSALLLMVILPQFWFRPGPTQAANPATLGQALANLLIKSLPLLGWATLFLFIWVNVFLGVRGRKPSGPAYRFISRPSNFIAGAPAWLGVFIIAISIMALVNITSDLARADELGEPPDPLAIILARLFPMAAVMGVLAIMLLFGGRRRLRRAWLGQPSVQLRHMHQFFDDRVVADNVQSRTETRWAAFRRVVETPNLFLLFHSDLTFDIIPKRAFQIPTDLDAFREFVRQRMGTQTQAFPVVRAVV